MSTVCTITVPTTEFRLGRALRAPDVRVELERTVQREGGLVVWAWVDDTEQYLTTLRRRGVDLECIEHVDGGLCFAVEHVGDTDAPSFLAVLREAGLPLLAASGGDREWTFRVRAGETGDLSGLRRIANERSIPVETSRTSPIHGCVTASLTSIQRETLVAAYRDGYYSTPRTATLADLGDRFDISPRAVSQRLRRGIGNLVEATLPTEREERPLLAEE